MEEQKYYIVSQKHMRRNEQIFLLWGQNFCGYTQDVNKAGKYTEKEVRAKYGEDFPIISNTYCVDKKLDNYLIPADDEAALNQIGLRKITVITYR